MSIATHATDPPRRTRLGFAFRVRTLLLLVAAVAAALGFADWWKRWSAVQALVSCVPVSVFVNSWPSYPDRDPTYDPGGTFRVAVRRVKELQQESNAVAALRKELRRALMQRDEKTMRGALAAMMYLGPSVADAGPEIVDVIQVVASRSEGPEHFDEARMLAVHLLGIVAATDRSYVPRLLDAIFLPDPSADKMVSRSAINELAPFVRDKNVTAQKLLAALNEYLKRHDAGDDIDDELEIRTGSVASLLSWLRESHDDSGIALSRLKSLVNERSRESFIRNGALWAIAYIYGGRNNLAALEELYKYLDELESDRANGIEYTTFVALRKYIDESEHVLRRRLEDQLLIESDRKLGGKPRPKPQTIPIESPQL